MATQLLRLVLVALCSLGLHVGCAVIVAGSTLVEWRSLGLTLFALRSALVRPCIDRAAANCSGRSFYFLKGAAAMLELALINYAMRFYQSRGYLPVTCPDLVRTHIAESCGFQPRDATSQVGDVHFTQTCL